MMPRRGRRRGDAARRGRPGVNLDPACRLGRTNAPAARRLEDECAARGRAMR
ncbi:hypothetical protein C7S17_4799 [Burkholderia thailandensis]|nr:hypothetical protein [Burkholderia thailandensis]